ncbi:MAG: hypothetical protein ACREUA_03770 [Burkholderiales bacterium]
MLPLWRDRLRIALSPECVALLRTGPGRRAAVKNKHLLACRPEGDAPGWQATLQALSAELKNPGWHPCAATVVLSNHFVRYLVIPWNEQVTSDVEHDAFVRHHFATVYGDVVADWEFRVSESGVGEPQLASAVDRALIGRLREVCAENKLALISVQPYLMAALNEWRRQIEGDSAWFLLAEPGRMCLALLKGNTWQCVHARRSAGALQDDVENCLNQELLMREASLTQSPVYCWAPAHADLAARLGSRRTLHALALRARSGFALENGPAYAMALCG